VEHRAPAGLGQRPKLCGGNRGHSAGSEISQTLHERILPRLAANHRPGTAPTLGRSQAEHDERTAQHRGSA
jgi:hypothetical protein